MSNEHIVAFLAGLTPENWLQISREIRADREISGFAKAQVSVYVSREYREALLVAEMIAKICRARSISNVKIERPFYDIIHKPISAAPNPFVDPRQNKAGHGSEAVQRFLLRSVTPPDPRQLPGTLGRQEPGEIHRDAALEDRRRELRASHRYQQDHETTDDDPTPNKGAA